MTAGSDATHSAPALSLVALTWRFLRFGLLAWGGPVAQIAMLRRSLVDEGGWISSERFNRTLAVYQVLPGPEAQELCIYFGTLSRGRIGGLLAGLAFLVPGLVTVIALAWFYVEIGTASPLVAAALGGAQAAVLGLIIRGVHRIGTRALQGRWLLAIGVAGLLSAALDAPFALPLVAGGLAYLLAQRRRPWAASAVLGLLLVMGAGLALLTAEPESAALVADGRRGSQPSLIDLAATGLKAGALTFGGAYTAIPFVQEDAVRTGGWLTDQQFLDALALSGAIPAPLIIFATFVGYVGAGLPGALAMTLGVFLPAFAMTLVGHSYLERAVTDRRLHAVLDGVTAAVVGLVAFTGLQLARATLTDIPSWGILMAATAVLYAWRSPAAIPLVVIGGGLIGILTRPF